MSNIINALLSERYRSGYKPKNLAIEKEKLCARIVDEGENIDWEESKCLCGGEADRILSEVDRHGLPYRKLICSICGLLRVSPRWTQERYDRFYKEDYRDLYTPLSLGTPGETLLRIANGPGAQLVSGFVLDAWQKYGDTNISSPTIIEIGAGGGWNLSRLPSNWRRIGYDTDERFLNLASKMFGIEMRRGFFDEAAPDLKEADCVLMSHVLEHVLDPVQVLKTLCLSVREDALILIEVPGIFRLHKTGLDPMRYWQNAHTYTFSARTLIDCCRRAGFEPVSIDEWIRLVLKPSKLSLTPIVNDSELAASTERYLRYCNNTSELAEKVGRVPIVGKWFSWFTYRCCDALVRIASFLGFLHFTSTSVLKVEQK